MWTKTRFAQWEVEGQVRERVNNALREGQQERLLKAARGNKTERTLKDLLNSIKASVGSGDLLASRMQLQDRTS